jgi:hypothetical protein
MVASSWVSAQERQRQQGGQRGGFGEGGVTALLAMPEVQKELSVNEEQKKLIADLVSDMRDAGGDVNFQELRDLSREEREKRLTEARRQRAERERKAEEMAKTILEPKQFDRLGELRLQREGVAALERPEVAEKLGLTAEQKERIGKLRAEARGDRGGPESRRDASREERRQAATEARQRREQANASILGVLTPQQKENWEKLQGAKFEFPQRRRPGGGAGSN